MSDNRLQKLWQEVELAKRKDLIEIEIEKAKFAESIKKTNRCVVLEEAWPLASISSEISYMMSQMVFDHLDAPIKRVTTLDTPLPYAATLVETWLPNVKRVVDAIDAVMYR